MPRIKIFLDSSVLFAGIASSEGAARVFLILGEIGQIQLVISEQVLVETERAIARKLPSALGNVRQAIHASGVIIVPDPTPEGVKAHLDWMKDLTDIPILLAAMQAGVDYLVTLNRRHFLDDAGVTQRSGLRIGTPGDALNWLRRNFIE
jgi:predicted nucleic acid-binding protein